MVTKKKDVRDVEQRQSDVGNPKEQQKAVQDTSSNNIQNTEPLKPLLEQKAEESLR